MGRYTTTMKSKPKKAGLHPIWRGIGCLTMVLIPIVSFAAASLSVNGLLARGLVPYQLMGIPRVPDWLWYAPVLAQAVQGLIARPNLYAVLVITVVYMIILGGVVSVVYAMVYRAFGPPRYGPTDAPPSKTKVKKYTR